MSEPEQILMHAAVDRLKPIAHKLREDGWAEDVIVNAEPMAVSIRVNLGGLKHPIEADAKDARVAEIKAEAAERLRYAFYSDHHELWDNVERDSVLFDVLNEMAQDAWLIAEPDKARHAAEQEDR